MAIFIASTKPITRSKGQSAVASACYRSGDKIYDERYNKIQDYSKRHGVMSADIILPAALKNTDARITRSELWNLAEHSETRKNSRVAREWLINLPYELDEDTRKALAHDFSQNLADKFQVIADCAIHRPTEREIEKGADARNYHAHIMLTTRKAELDADGSIMLTVKSDCELSDTQRKDRGLSRAKEEVKEIRELWEALANEKLLEHGVALIDSRSYASQGIELTPQIKMGKKATQLERKGVNTVEGNVNRLITERNELVWNRQLNKNERSNDKAKQIIFEKRKQNERIPEPTASITPIQSPSKIVQSPAVMQALALAKTVKQKHSDQAKDNALARAEQLRLEREQRQQQAQLAQRQHEQAQAAERQRITAKFEREAKQYMADKAKRDKQLLTTITQHPIKGVDANSQLGQLITSISVAHEALDGLEAYKSHPDTTDYQKQLADRERDYMSTQVVGSCQNALSEIQALRYSRDRKTHTAALQSALNEFSRENHQNMTQTQQKDVQSVKTAIDNYSQEINRSRDFEIGY